MTTSAGPSSWPPVSPTACASGTRLRPTTPVFGPTDRCPDCGHAYVNHTYARCDLCLLALELLATRAEVARLLDPGLRRPLPVDPEECG